MLRAGLPWVVRTPGINRLFVVPRTFTVPCGRNVWSHFTAEIHRTEGVESLVVYQSQWRNLRFSVMGLSQSREVKVFAQIRPSHLRHLLPSPGPWSFQVPEMIGELSMEDWDMRLFAPMPALHEPMPWNAKTLAQVGRDASLALRDQMPESDRPRSDWVPIHGDFTPWNLRIDMERRLWLIDWEQATWAPPLADLLRFILSYGALQGDDQNALVDRVQAELPERAKVADAAAFWLNHEIFRSSGRPDSGRQDLDRGNVADWEYAGEQVEALRRLADGR